MAQPATDMAGLNGICCSSQPGLKEQVINSNIQNDELVMFQKLLSSARNSTSGDRAELLESFRNYLRKIAAEAIGSEPIGQLSTSDVVQTAIIDAHGDFDQCRAVSYEEFKAWLRQILINDIMNRFRDLRRQKRDIARERDIDSNLQLIDEIDSPSEQLIRKENERRLLDALSKLSDDQRQVIELRQRDGLTFVEIAEQLNRTPDATRMLWNRAVDALAKILQQDKN